MKYKNLKYINEENGIFMESDIEGEPDRYLDPILDASEYQQALNGAYGPIAPYEPPPPPTDEQLAAEARTERNQLLADSDWTQLPDARNAMGNDKAAEWDTYRQDLRDITAQAGFPREIEWPTKPE